MNIDLDYRYILFNLYNIKIYGSMENILDYIQQNGIIISESIRDIYYNDIEYNLNTCIYVIVNNFDSLKNICNNGKIFNEKNCQSFEDSFRIVNKNSLILNDKNRWSIKKIIRNNRSFEHINILYLQFDRVEDILERTDIMHYGFAMYKNKIYFNKKYTKTKNYQVPGLYNNNSEFTKCVKMRNIPNINNTIIIDKFIHNEDDDICYAKYKDKKYKYFCIEIDFDFELIEYGGQYDNYDAYYEILLNCPLKPSCDIYKLNKFLNSTHIHLSKMEKKLIIDRKVKCMCKINGDGCLDVYVCDWYSKDIQENIIPIKLNDNVHIKTTSDIKSANKVIDE